MIILDKVLQRKTKESGPINVALVGAGFIAKGIVHQISNYVPGINIAVICNRTIDHAEFAFNLAGINKTVRVSDSVDLDVAIDNNVAAITDDYKVICSAKKVDLIVESTGNVDHGAQVITTAIQHGKDVVNMNAELDATVGPLLYIRAQSGNCIVTGCDGDQPATQTNLYRYVKSLGLTPLICGNIKGLQDYYRTPETQAGFAKQWGQSPTMVTSFADGTKISMEQALVANATGMQVAKRGMLGYEYSGHVDDMTGMYDVEKLTQIGGIVDYVVGPKPGPGVFVFAHCGGDEVIEKYLKYGKLGAGPLYSFYTPYHLTALEVPHSIARVNLFKDEIVVPTYGPMVDVIAIAKRNMQSGEVLDGLGGFDTYGQCENYKTAVSNNLLPMGIAEGARLKRHVVKDQCLTYDDVELSTERVSVELRMEQNAIYST